MKGKHKIEVRSGRVVFTIELERNITILRGDSATGKTTLVEMLQAYETYGRQSGVTVSCDKPCRVLSGVNWELQLNATHDSIVFVDEGVPLFRVWISPVQSNIRTTTMCWSQEKI